MSYNVVSILFVCMGNICRSPALQAALQKLVHEKKLDDKVYIDSCAMTTYYIGKQADPRMCKAAEEKNIKIKHTARLFERQDFDIFDYIIGVNHEVVDLLKAEANTAQELSKIHMAGEYSKKHPGKEMPDPYYGNEWAFDKTMESAMEIAAGFFEEHLHSLI